MVRVIPIDMNQAEGKAKTMFDGVEKSFVMAPNLKSTLGSHFVRVVSNLNITAR